MGIGVGHQPAGDFGRGSHLFEFAVRYQSLDLSMSPLPAHGDLPPFGFMLKKFSCWFLFIVREDDDEGPRLDFTDEAPALRSPLGVRADGRLDRHPDPFLDPLGSVVHEIAVCVSDYQHVDVVWGSARLAQIARGPRTDQEHGFSPLDVGELLGDYRRRAVGGENDAAHRAV